MRGANIFLAYKDEYTLQQLMNIRVRQFETGFLHELFTAPSAFARPSDVTFHGENWKYKLIFQIWLTGDLFTS